MQVKMAEQAAKVLEDGFVMVKGLQFAKAFEVVNVPLTACQNIT